MSAPTVLVTGGTGGIGAVVATAMAAGGAHLLVTGRDGRRGEVAADTLLAAGASGAEFLAVDHADVARTAALGRSLTARLGRLDVLVANAGVMPAHRIRTPEGLDVEIAVDVVGVVALVDALRPLLHAAPAGRVVLVISGAALHGSPPALEDDPWGEAPGATMRSYARAKRAKLALAAGLAVEEGGSGVVVHAAAPGPAWTPMTRSLDRHALGMSPPAWWMVRAVQRLGSPARAARCVVAAATGPDHASPGGLLVGARGARAIPVRREEAASVLSRARAMARAAGQAHG
ncbi:SDR family NAD(P)-dependent oxidoreductase [Blastococcus litoris]|uniref:SDR family NAD(P)-dependent oxidoreductase n=1 Tax=Blastococcus litoris TaxID=2171622 RepID=UPI0013E0E14A|nr:SDR family NAD(P)-dependent oxidoreductase [Blastococcus litoris]